MKKLLLLDSANFYAARAFCSSDAVSGVTTNPSLMAKEGKGDYIDKLKHIANELGIHGEKSGQKKHLSVEVTSLEPGAMVGEAINLHAGLKDFPVDLYVKIPIGAEYLEVMTDLSHLKIRVNATAIMTYAQAKLATDAGASIVSFFYNRMKDGGVDPAEISKFSHFCVTAKNQAIVTSDHDRFASIICGSIRKPEDVLACWDLGADIVTASPKIIEELCSHPETTKALDQFKKDIDAWRS